MVNRNLLTRIKTGKVRLSFCNIWEPKASFDGAKPKYSTSVIVSKKDTKTIDAINAAIEAAYEEGLSKLKGNAKTAPALNVLKTPLRDGDLERPDDEAYKDSYFFNANSTTAPGVVDADLNDILDHTEIYSGVYARVSVTFYAYNTGTAKGIACGLNNIMKLEDGDPLSGRVKAADDFAEDNALLS